MLQYKPQECRACEPRLATRHLSRNTEEGPCHAQEGHTGGTTPALQPQESCVHNTSVTFRAAARAEPPSSLILIIVEVQVRQRRVCLVRIARTFHGATWSTHLTLVDNHVSPTTPHAKLMELLHSMPCPACRDFVDTEKSQKLYSCVDQWRVECIHTISIHHQKTSLREVKTRHRIHPTPHSPNAIACRLTHVYL